MNFGRLVLLVLSGWLFSGAGHVFSEVRLSDSEFENWMAVVSERALPDGSVLFDYMANTVSEQTEGAMLGISFVPRFSCVPILSVRTSTGSKSVKDIVPEPVVLEITVDSERLLLDGLMDANGEHLLYGIHASSDLQAELREKMDVATHFTFKVLGPGVQGQASIRKTSIATSDEGIYFSLLGSRLSTQAAENYCMAHTPLAFKPR